MPAPPGLEGAMRIEMNEVYQAGEDLLIRLRDEEQLKALEPQIHRLIELDVRGIIATSGSEHCDFSISLFCTTLRNCGRSRDRLGTLRPHTLLVPFAGQDRTACQADFTTGWRVVLPKPGGESSYFRQCRTLSSR